MELGDIEVKKWRRNLMEEVKKVGYIAGPMVVVAVLQYLVPVVSTMMVGHLGNLALSSVAIATSLTNVTGFSLLSGLVGGLETLCGQAYGAKQYQKLGLYTYSAVFSLLLVCIPVSAAWVFMDKLLLLMRLDPLVSLEARNYSLRLIPALFGAAVSKPLVRYLQTQSLVWPMLLSSFLVLCFHVPTTWALVYEFDMGTNGAAIAVCVSSWLYVFVLAMYIKFSASCKNTRLTFSVEAFRAMPHFLRLAVPSAVMVCLKWWSLELLVLLSGLLPNPTLETSVLSICLTISTLHFTIPYGLGAAASTRVANELGAGNPDKAGMVVWAVMLLAVKETIAVSILLFCLRHIVGRAYSNEQQVVKYIARMTPLVCLSIMTDNLQAVISGIARGCGWQHIGAYVNLCAFYLVGIPVAVVLGFVEHLKARGFWMGIVIGSVLQSSVLAVITCLTDWNKQARKAKERMIEEAPSSQAKYDDKPFECGNIGYISYPFWGGDRPSECGRQGFELVCHNNIPTLTISSSSYLVQKLDFGTNTLTVARQDLHDTTCPDPPLHNTTIDWDLFRQPAIATDRNITLYFDCSGGSNDEPNAFPCNNRSNNLFSVGGGNRSCSSNIYVPINNKDPESLEIPTPSSINILRSALTAGFSIQWLSDSKQSITPFCNTQVYASCVPNRPYKRRPCEYATNCIRRSSASTGNHQGPAPAPSSRPLSDHVMPPAPTPGIENAPGLPPLPIATRYPPQTQTIQKGKNGVKETVIVAVVALSLAATIIASLSIHCLLKRRRLVTGLNPQCKRDVENFLLHQGALTPKRFKYCEIKKMTKSFRDKLGQGGYGSVYKGMLPDGCPVAVKILIEMDSNGEEFMNEVASISRTSHVNIVTLLGFCYEGKRRALVYEFMPNCSLDKFLNNNQSAGGMACRLDLEKLYEIAVGIAKGLEYLHTGCNTRIIHFDIKPQNILLDEDLCPKISDFGLAKLCKKKQSILSMPGTRGTIGYIAPEVFSRNFGGVSHKSDVYSYGMMLLEMAGARKLSEAEVIQSSENYFPDRIYEQVISSMTKKLDDFTMELAEEESRTKMCVVGFWCIQTIPSNRPSISKVVEMLEGSVESIEIPPKPLLLAPNLPTHQASSSLSTYVTENSAGD